jgi:hypothetical protein
MAGIDDFETFLRWKLDPQRPYQFHIDTSIERQSDYLIDLHGNIIVDFIGKYENLEEDFRQVCERIGVRAPKLAHKRQAKDRSSYQKYYTDETAALVSDYFRRDIEMFGYSF